MQSLHIATWHPSTDGGSYSVIDWDSKYMDYPCYKYMIPCQYVPMTFSGGDGVAVAGLQSTVFSFKAVFWRYWATSRSSVLLQSSHKPHRSWLPGPHHLSADPCTPCYWQAFFKHKGMFYTNMPFSSCLTPLSQYLKLTYVETPFTSSQTLFLISLSRTSGKGTCKLNILGPLLLSTWQ